MPRGMPSRRLLSPEPTGYPPARPGAQQRLGPARGSAEARPGPRLQARPGAQQYARPKYRLRRARLYACRAWSLSLPSQARSPSAPLVPRRAAAGGLAPPRRRDPSRGSRLAQGPAPAPAAPWGFAAGGSESSAGANLGEGCSAGPQGCGRVSPAPACRTRHLRRRVRRRRFRRRDYFQGSASGNAEARRLRDGAPIRARRLILMARIER